MPRHGTNACYASGCRKPKCVEAHREEVARYRSTPNGKKNHRKYNQARRLAVAELITEHQDEFSDLYEHYKKELS